VLDASTSMSGTPAEAAMKSAAIDFVKNILAASSRNYVAVVVVDAKQKKVQSEFSKDFSELEKEINNFKCDGTPTTYKKLAHAQDLLSSVKASGRVQKNVVLFTDVLPTGESKTKTVNSVLELAQTLWETASVYTVGFIQNTKNDQTREEFGKKYLEDLSNTWSSVSNDSNDISPLLKKSFVVLWNSIRMANGASKKG